MKKLLSLISVLTLTLTLSACSNYEQNRLEACTGNDDTETSSEGESIVPENQITFMHKDGGGGEKEEPIHLLFEYQSLKYTKYQIAYQSCT